ncbi:MAG: VCBS repeat-containing protein [Phycisphaerales bacterium]
MDRYAPAIASLLAAAGVAQAQGPLAEPFTADFAVEQILPDLGGDGSLGLAFIGRAGDTARLPAGVGDINGDGVDDFAVISRDDVVVVFGRGDGALPPLLDESVADGVRGFRVAGDFRYGGADSIGQAGDVNGDGLDDLLISARGATLGLTREGMAWVIFGRGMGDPFPAEVAVGALGGGGVAIRGGEAEAGAGASAAASGDVNGDGLDDILIGAPGLSLDGYSLVNAGAAYVVFGRETWPGMPVDLSQLDGMDGFRMEGPARVARMGSAVSAAGDINGDGVNDVLLGAYYDQRIERCSTYSCYYMSAGRAFVVYGRPDGTPFPVTMSVNDLDGTDGFAISGGDVSSYLGRSVSGGRDLNGDGLDDIAIGAPGSDPERRSTGLPENNGGEAYVLFGNARGFPAAVDLDALQDGEVLRIRGVGDHAWLGWSLSLLDDFSGDNRPDLLVGAPSSGSGIGLGYVVLGSDALPDVVDAADLDGSLGFRVSPEATDERFGVITAHAGDPNRYGRADFFIGSPQAEHGADALPGRHYLVYGRSPCPADFDGDGELTIFDFLALQNAFDAMDPVADFDGDGELTIFDFLAFQNAFDAGCP